MHPNRQFLAHFVDHTLKPILCLVPQSTAVCFDVIFSHDPRPPLHSNRPCIPFIVSGEGGGARETLFPVSQIYSEGRILSLSCAFAGWTRWYYWCIAVYFRFFASKALHRTLCHAEHFSVSQSQPWMLILLTLDWSLLRGPHDGMRFAASSILSSFPEAPETTRVM